MCIRYWVNIYSNANESNDNGNDIDGDDTVPISMLRVLRALAQRTIFRRRRRTSKSRYCTKRWYSNMFSFAKNKLESLFDSFLCAGDRRRKKEEVEDSVCVYDGDECQAAYGFAIYLGNGVILKINRRGMYYDASSGNCSTIHKALLSGVGLHSQSTTLCSIDYWLCNSNEQQ